MSGVDPLVIPVRVMLRLRPVMFLRLTLDAVETIIVAETIATEVAIRMVLAALLMQLGIAPLGQACLHRRWHGPRLEYRLALVGSACRRLTCRAHDRLAQSACLGRHRRCNGVFGQPGLDMSDRRVVGCDR